MPITRIVVAHRPALVRRASRVLRVANRSIGEISPPAQAPAIIEAS